MDALSLVDWKSIFVPTLSIAEIVLRGTLVYLVLFVILRLMRREAGALGISDLLVVVLIADAAQNAMGREYDSVTEGAVLVVTIALCDYALDWLGYRFPRVQRWLRPSPLPLIKDGRMMKRNMRQQTITEEELIGQLREQGVEHAGGPNAQKRRRLLKMLNAGAAAAASHRARCPRAHSESR